MTGKLLPVASQSTKEVTTASNATSWQRHQRSCDCRSMSLYSGHM